MMEEEARQAAEVVFAAARLKEVEDAKAAAAVRAAAALKKAEENAGLVAELERLKREQEALKVNDEGSFDDGSRSSRESFSRGSRLSGARDEASEESIKPSAAAVLDRVKFSSPVAAMPKPDVESTVTWWSRLQDRTPVQHDAAAEPSAVRFALHRDSPNPPHPTPTNPNPTNPTLLTLLTLLTLPC